MSRQSISRAVRTLTLQATVITLVVTVALKAAEKQNPRYVELVNKVMKGDLSVDFRALRVSRCAKADNCDPRGDNKDLIAMQRATQARDYKEVVKIAEKLITVGFPNIQAHAACAEAYTALKQPGQGAVSSGGMTALIRSIMSTGDGKTQETAFEVIGTQEEHIVLSLLGLPPLAASLSSRGKPHSYDLIEVDDVRAKSIRLFQHRCFLSDERTWRHGNEQNTPRQRRRDTISRGAPGYVQARD